MGDDNPAMDNESLAVIFKDEGTMQPWHSLAYFQKVQDDLEGMVIRLEAQRGKPDIIYNTKVFTDRNEEIWLSGFTCGKEHAGSLGLCELVLMIGWEKYVPRTEIARVVLSNNSFRMEFKGEKEKKLYYVFNGESL